MQYFINMLTESFRFVEDTEKPKLNEDVFSENQIIDLIYKFEKYYDNEPLLKNEIFCFILMDIMLCRDDPSF